METQPIQVQTFADVEREILESRDRQIFVIKIASRTAAVMVITAAIAQFLGGQFKIDNQGAINNVSLAVGIVDFLFEFTIRPRLEKLELPPAFVTEERKLVLRYEALIEKIRMRSALEPSTQKYADAEIRLLESLINDAKNNLHVEDSTTLSPIVNTH